MTSGPAGLAVAHKTAQASWLAQPTAGILGDGIPLMSLPRSRIRTHILPRGSPRLKAPLSPNPHCAPR